MSIENIHVNLLKELLEIDADSTYALIAKFQDIKIQ